jgi:hypothetical protein
MKMKTVLAAVLTLTVAAPAVAQSPAGPAQKPKRQCFFASRVTSFAAADEKIVNLRVGVRDFYQLEMFGPCQDVDWNNQIALVSRGTSTICTGFDAEIISQTTLGPRRCLVRSVRKLTPVEVAALPSRAKP